MSTAPLFTESLRPPAPPGMAPLRAVGGDLKRAAENFMSDVITIGITAVFFGLSWGLVVFCDRLERSRR